MYRTLLICPLLSLCFSLTVSYSLIDSDDGLSPVEIIQKYGYPFEPHTVQTSDGYLLTLHRIPYGVKNSTLAKTRPPVLVVHGVFGSSADFIIMGPNRSLSFQLADAGYDVWLANCRGNTWSRKHIHLDPDKDSAKFFNYSFEDHGVFDLPAQIDYVLNITNQSSLFYVAHSQGTTSTFALLSLKPEYNRKIKIAANLASVAYLNNAMGLVRLLSSFNYNITADIANLLGFHEILSKNSTFRRLEHFLSEIPIVQEVVVLVMSALVGFDSAQLDRSTLSTFATNYPAGGSIKELLHFMQIRQSGRFARYNYGRLKNWKVYHRAEPPVYNLSNITAPIILHYSQNDYFASVEDVWRLASELANAKLKLVPLPAFNHLDFLYAKDAHQLVYKDIIAEFKAYK